MTKIAINLEVKKLTLYFSLMVIAVGIGRTAALSPEYSKWLIVSLILASTFFSALMFPYYAFLIFIVTLPLEATLVIEAGFTIRPSYIILLILLIGLFIRTLMQGTIRDIKTPLNIPILTYIVIAAISLLIATLFYPPPQSALQETMKYRGSELRGLIQIFLLIFFTLTYFLTVYFCSDVKKLLTAIKVHVGTAIILALYGIYQFFANYFNLPLVDITNALSTGGGSYGATYSTAPGYFRSHATFQEPSIFGHYLLTAVPLILAIYLYQKKSEKQTKLKISIISILIMLFAIVFTKSHGTWLGFFIALIIMLIFSKQEYRLKLIDFISRGFIIFCLIAFIFLPSAYKNIGDIFLSRTSHGELQRDPRIPVYNLNINLIKQYPILGIGFGQYSLHGASHFGSGVMVSAHGVYWQSLAETGIIGFSVLVWLIFVFYRTLFRTLKKVKGTPWYPYILGYLACFSGIMIQYFFFADRLNMYVWFFMGISMATSKLINKKLILHD